MAVLLFNGERDNVGRKGALIHQPWVQPVVSPAGTSHKTPLLRDTAGTKCKIVWVLPWHAIGLPMDNSPKAFWMASAPPAKGPPE